MKFMIPILLAAFLAGCANLSQERNAQVTPSECTGSWDNIPSWCFDRN